MHQRSWRKIPAQPATTLMDASITDTRARLRTMAIPYTFDACLPAYTFRKALYVGREAIIELQPKVHLLLIIKIRSLAEQSIEIRHCNICVLGIHRA